MKKQIPKPENWQDFESLCKKMYGEMWKCEYSIKKNGRQGQNQFGVDIYGIPKGENEYWGIQCKGKDSYTHAKLTEKEIEEEIEKALKFEPLLKTFIIATTANKDASIEAFVRKKDIESRANGNFNIILHSWEDIADFIEENRETNHYYLSANQFKSLTEIEVLFENGQKEIEIKPQYERKIVRYLNKNKLEGIHKIMFQHISIVNKFPKYDIGLKKYQSMSSFNLKIINSGNEPIDDWKLKITLEADIIKFTDTEYMNTFLNPTACAGNQANYKGSSIIPKDKLELSLYVKPHRKEYTIPIKWEIISRNYSAIGDLNIYIKPAIKDKIDYIFVETDEEVKPDEIIADE